MFALLRQLGGDEATQMLWRTVRHPLTPLFPHSVFGACVHPRPLENKRFPVCWPLWRLSGFRPTTSE
jgi:hypothetical protein